MAPKAAGVLPVSNALTNSSQRSLLPNAQEFLHVIQGHAVAVGQGQLFQQVFGVAQTAGGVSGGGPERVRFHCHTFAGGYLLQAVVDDFGGETAEVVALAAGNYCRQNAVGFGGAEDKDDVGRRFLEGFEESVGGLVGQHMGFVNDIDLAGSFHGGEVHLVADVADFVNAAVAGGVQFDDVQATAFVGPRRTTRRNCRGRLPGGQGS